MTHIFLRAFTYFKLFTFLDVVSAFLDLKKTTLASNCSCKIELISLASLECAKFLGFGTP